MVAGVMVAGVMVAGVVVAGVVELPQPARKLVAMAKQTALRISKCRMKVT